MVMLIVAFTQLHNARGLYFYTQLHFGSHVLTLLFGPSLFTTLHTCTTILPPPPMPLLLMSFMGISFLVINSTSYMFGAVRCTSLIQKYQMVKTFPAGNQSPGMDYFLGIVLLIPVTSLWFWTLPQGISPLSTTWCLMTPSARFSLSLMIKTPQYSGTTSPLNHQLIKSHYNLGIILYFMING